MNTAKLLTHLLPSRAPECYQDAQFHTLDKADIAMALAFVPKVSYYLVSWHLLQDKTLWRPLVEIATIHMQRLAKRERWKQHHGFSSITGRRWQ